MKVVTEFGTEYKDQESHNSCIPHYAGMRLKVERKLSCLSEKCGNYNVATNTCRGKKLFFNFGSYKDEESAYKEWGIIGGHHHCFASDIRLTATSFNEVGWTLINETFRMEKMISFHYS